MILLRRIFLYFLPACLLWYGGDKMDKFFFGHPEHNATNELICYLVGIAIINIVVPFSTEKTRGQIIEQDCLIGILLKGLRENLNTELEHKFNTENLELNIRIFVPKKSFKLWFKKIVFKERVFILKDHPNLCIDSIDTIPFRVSPNPEGVVGKVFEAKCMMYDSELTSEKSEKHYKLNPHQISLLSDTKFVIAMPIFRDGSKDVITAIVSFDTKKSITLPTNNDWERSVRESCMIIRKCIPFICKKN